MKKSLLLLSFIIYSVTSPCQQIPNGGFELWDTTSLIIPTPKEWITNNFFPSLPCAPSPITVTRINDVNSGDWAAKLEAVSCYDAFGMQKIYMGFLALGDPNTYPQLAYGINYNERPDYFSFYYKFNKMGNDTGFAKITLRLYDSIGNAGPIVGEGQVNILNDINNYTFINIPINYLLNDTPQIIQIVFATSKTLQDVHLLSTTPGNGANLGTTLWIDDVSVSGGTLNIPYHLNENKFNIYPNPTINQSYLDFQNLNKEKYFLEIYNYQGKLLRTINEIKVPLILEKENLSSGLYYFHIKSRDGLIQTGKWIIN